jgi:hypothetical protein
MSRGNDSSKFIPKMEEEAPKIKRTEKLVDW